MYSRTGWCVFEPRLSVKRFLIGYVVYCREKFNFVFLLEVRRKGFFEQNMELKKFTLLSLSLSINSFCAVDKLCKVKTAFLKKLSIYLAGQEKGHQLLLIVSICFHLNWGARLFFATKKIQGTSVTPNLGCQTDCSIKKQNSVHVFSHMKKMHNFKNLVCVRSFNYLASTSIIEYFCYTN